MLNGNGGSMRDCFCATSNNRAKKMDTAIQVEAEKKLLFAINGDRYEVPSIHPSTTLLQFIRSNTSFKSLKLSCGEGGCGSCVVLLSKYDPVLDQVEDFTVSSCLTLLCSINGCSITTTEGLGNSTDGFHPIHQRIAGFHASQCGFCTPGMCVSLFSALVNADKTCIQNPRPGFSNLTMSEAEKSISGNLCRCTGYRPIADACKSFASDVDMEDLGLNSFWKKGESEEMKLSKLPLYNPIHKICTFPNFLKQEMKYSMRLEPTIYSWYNPVSIEELQSLLELSEKENVKTKLVVGNTGSSYYKEIELYDKYIDLRFITELSMINRDHTGIQFGANITISKAILALKEENMMVFTKIADHMEKIASGFIRNSASLGGNLVMAQRNNFPSDIATILLVAASTVNIMTGKKCENLTFEEFLVRPPLGFKSILLSIKIPSLEPLRNTLLFETYRAAPRPLGNALPYLNAAFLAEVSNHETYGRVVINNIQLAFGAYGTKHAIRARKVEEFLAGKVLTTAVLSEAVKLVRATVVPDDNATSRAYRESLAVGYLFEFLRPFIEASAHLPNRHLTLLSSGKQVIGLSREYCPVGEPITKSGAALQASGEAVYVDDIPSPIGCLHGAFVYSTKPMVRIKGVKLKSNLQNGGVYAIISAKDIMKSGENVGAQSRFGWEPLFPDELTMCAGQSIAMVVADTQKNADMAANLSVVEYDMEDLEPPILTVEEAVEKSSFFEIPPMFYQKPVGDFSKGMAEADHTILSAEIKLGSQYHFYMETQTALAVPDEDNCMVVYSSCQSPENLHVVVAKCLGIPAHNVRVITRRVGGGFGGKGVRSMHVATACALAAQKLRCPVRIYVNRKTDMIIIGGRHPMKITYDVGFKSSGKITALHLEILINAGISEDVSAILVPNMTAELKKYDWGALAVDFKLCKTNHTSKTAMRAPGGVQATFIAEAVIEHVASTLSLDVDSVRVKNLHTFESLGVFYGGMAGDPLEYTLASIWHKLARFSNFEERREMVEDYNKSNQWCKKGISRVPIVYAVTVRPTPGKVSILSDGSIVVEVGGIELGQGLWTKVKQMIVFALDSIHRDGDGDLLEKVRVIQADTLSLIQGGITAGSTTSESSCEAVRLCCKILVDRLMPVKERLKEQMGSVSWEMLISQAYMQAVNLSASSYFVPDFSSMKYLNYGAAVSEVEVNLVTGETTILQVDILYDCGQSLNPAVDLGQIEGAFVQGLGFFMLEEYQTNTEGLMLNDGTWTYKIPTIDTIPKQFNVEIINSGHHQNRVLSSKASSEPPLLLAVSVHCATRAAIREAREQLRSWRGGVEDGYDSTFQLEVPCTMPVVKELCGFDIVERYLQLPHPC